MFLLNALLRKKWVITVCTLAGIGAGILFTLTKKKLYLSAAQYSTGFTMKQQVRLSDESASGVFEVDQRFKNVIETFKSPVVIAMLSYDLMLHDLAEKTTPFKLLDQKEKLKPAYTEGMADINKTRQLLLEKKAAKDLLKAYNADEKKVYELIKLYGYDNETLLNTLTVDRIAGTDYLNILFRSENPEMSAYVVNTLGDEFIRFYSSLSIRRTEESAGRLDTLAQKKKLEIDSLNKTLQIYKASFGTPDVMDNAKGSLEIVRELNTQKFEAESELNKLQADLNSVNTQLENIRNLPSNQSNAGGGGNNSEYVNLLNKNRELAAEMSRKPGGFDAELDAQMKVNQKKIQQISVSKVGGTDAGDSRRKKDELLNQKISLENKIRGQQTTIGSLNSQISQYQVRSKTGAGADVRERDLVSKIDMASKQYELMLNKLQGAEDINLAPDINFKQTLLGQPAIKPESSNRKLTIGLSAFAALLLSALFVIILDFVDHSLRSPSVFNKVVKLKLLSVVNNASFKSKNIEDYFSPNLPSDQRAGSNNQMVEAMRKLRYEIEESGKKIILFTSTKPKEGKSMIIEALAHSFSTSKKRVLLIDTNFSNNTLTDKFNAKPLLEQFSSNGDRDITVKLIDITSGTSIPNCDIIGCNEGNFSPAEILPKNNLLEHLASITSRYDFVLMEGAALNEQADTKELAKYAEVIIPVFSARSAIKPADMESIKFLKTQQEKVIGAVLNNVEKENVNL